MNITADIQLGKGSAINRLLKNAAKAEKKGDTTKAARFRQAAENLKNAQPTIWG